MTFPLKGKKVWVAGHRGMVGSAVVRALSKENCEILTADRNNLDLTCQDQVQSWIFSHKPQAVVLAAAKVGGIMANNQYPADFLYENLMIEANVIHSSYKAGVEKLLFLGSSCIYPRNCPQPIKEEYLLTDVLESTNEWYAIAKIAGIKLCQAYFKQHGCNFISAMPTNLYGIGDTYSIENSHVIPALIMKIDKALRNQEDEVEIWGTGTPRREFLYADDLAEALIFLLKNYSDPSPINVGCGEDVSITDLARLVAQTIGFKGGFRFNTEKPDGTPRKLLDVRKLKEMGWVAQTSLDVGLKYAYQDYLNLG
jgi:GDP-L-fucose synthase